MLAHEVMNPNVATVFADAPILKAISVMEAQHCSGLPVLDANKRLVGILTEGDLLRRMEMGTAGRVRTGWLDWLLGPAHAAADYVLTHSRRVEDVMTRNVVTVTKDAPLQDVVALMQRKHVKRLPVVRDDEVVGIISRADLVRALGRALKAAALGGTTDTSIQERLEADLHAQDWFRPEEVRVAVHGGVVILEGVVSDERARTALRVAAQNVAGVAAVEDKLVWVDPAASGLVF